MDVWRKPTIEERLIMRWYDGSQQQRKENIDYEMAASID
jgi:hypothetical protein